MSDPRFAHAASAPLFKHIKKSNQKLKIDDRFKGSLTDVRFASGPANRKSTGGKIKTELSEFYETNETGNDVKRKEEMDNKSSEPGTRLDYLNKLARGEIGSSSDSSSGTDSRDNDEYEKDGSDSDSSSSDDVDSELEDAADARGVLAVPGSGVQEMGDATKRVAILNCDWEHITAVDLMAILESFCPPAGVVQSIIVYVSDYGKEQMLMEEKYGPRGIWTVSGKVDSSEDGSSDSGSDEDDVDRNENDGVYDKIEMASELGSDENEEAHRVKQEERCCDSSSKKKGEAGDFRRKQGAVGLVLHDELVSRNATNPSGEGGAIDEVALRKYELQKLRYYFAVATCDTTATASALYDQLDNIEFENSAMALDLRFVPEEVARSPEMRSRTIRDSCDGVPHGYRPPDFVVNALQHTSVQCTWDEGEKNRERKLTNVSGWRKLKDSEFQQYIASESDSSDEEAQGGLKSNRAKKMRALLLGDKEEGSEEESEDDFFVRDESESNNSEENDDYGEEKVLEFIPESDKTKNKEVDVENETPLERARRKLAEKKKRRKQTSKTATSLDDESQTDGVDGVNEEKARRAHLEMLFAGDDDDEEDEKDQLRDVVREKNKRGKKKVRKEDEKKSDTLLGPGTTVNVADSRFRELFNDDGRFGIDRTAPEFRDTSEGLKVILAEQQRRRTDKKAGGDSSANKKISGNLKDGAESDVHSLANKLKRKFDKK